VTGIELLGWFVLAAWLLNLGYAALAAHAARQLATFQQRLHGLDRVAGALFIGFGVKLALTESPQG
jgi:threonine/homoserine/homoserine lactone efflux protein